MKTIHPFPARMAPAIVLRKLDEFEAGSIVLDPMSGSGTTSVAARSRNLQARGCDTDPLALTIARANTQDLDPAKLAEAGNRALRQARHRARFLKPCNAYPKQADAETAAFIDYWFDPGAKIELEALSRSLEDADSELQDFLKCAYSRMIITKKHGVSLAEDVSHSRPHKTRNVAPVRPFELFERCVAVVARSTNFRDKTGLPNAKILKADCRQLPFGHRSIDHIVTSPPYLNAIDYLRGHKMSLVWLGFNIADLRAIRRFNIGTEVGHRDESNDTLIEAMITSELKPSGALHNRLRRYVRDLDAAISEMSRVLRTGGTLTMVVGDCTIRGCDIRNSIAIDLLAKRHGFKATGWETRELSPQHRYLPPPRDAGTLLSKRISFENLLSYELV